MMSRKQIQIVYRPTETVLAEGPAGIWDIFEFDGGYYIPWRCVRADGVFRPNFLPGLCPYKGIYVGMNLRLSAEVGAWNLGWLYWLPNPLLPFIWYRLVLPVGHPDLQVNNGDLLSRSKSASGTSDTFYGSGQIDCAAPRTQAVITALKRGLATLQ